VGSACKHVADVLRDLDASAISGLTPKERRCLHGFEVSAADHERFVEMVTQEFVENGIGYDRLFGRVFRQSLIRALHDNVTRFSSKSGMSALDFFSTKYETLMRTLNLPYHDIMFIDRNLWGFMPRSPVRSGKVFRTRGVMCD
jgi:hypothetical protein